MQDTRFTFPDTDSDTDRGTPMAGFVALPVMLMAGGSGTFQSQIYEWAFQQAAVTTAPPPPKPSRPDLFAIFN